MLDRIIFVFAFSLSSIFTHGQSFEALAKKLFPTEVKLQKSIQLMDDAFDFKKKGAFWEMTAPNNNWKEAKKNKYGVNPNGNTELYEIEFDLDYDGRYKRYDIETIEINGSEIPLFGKQGAAEQLSAIDNHRSLLYQTNEDGYISRILLKEIKAIAELTYIDGNLVSFEMTTEDYWGEPRKFIRDYAKMKIAEACAKSFTPISLEKRLDLSSYEPTCIAFCDSSFNEEPHVMYGNLIYNGPIKNGLPEGEGWWATNNPCHGFFDLKKNESIQRGTFKAGVAVGWHTFDRDSVEVEYFYEDGIITAVKGVPILLPFDGIGYLDTDILNGVYQDNEAVIHTGEDHKTYVKMVNGKPLARDNIMKYYDKNGSFVTLHLDDTGKKIQKLVRQSPDKKMTLTEFANSEGELLSEKRLEVKKFDLRNPLIMPQSIIVEGDIKVDLPNNKWGGENLRISFPDEKGLTLTGSFIPAYFYWVSTAPTGKHILRGPNINKTGTYEEGRFVSGDEIYKLRESYSKLPMTINFNRETNPTAFYSYEDEITIPLPPKAFGIGFERPVINDKGCTFEYMLNRTDGKLVHWLEKSLDGGEILSYDLHENIGPQKRKSFNYLELKVRRKDCENEFIQVYLFE